VQLPDRAAIPTTHPDRQASISMAGSDEIGERQQAPATASRAVGRELVPMRVQAGEGAEVDHA